MKYSGLKTDIDTTCNGWHVIVTEAKNGLIYKDEDSTYTDISYFVTIYKDGKLLFNKKEITTPGLFGTFETNKSLLQLAEVAAITNTNVYLSFWVCEPESDCGGPYTCAFSKKGSMKICSTDDMLEYVYINIFYSMCINEFMQKPVDKASLHIIAKKYCTDSLVNYLDKNGYMSIFPTNITSKDFGKVWLDNHQYEPELSGCSPEEEQCFGKVSSESEEYKLTNKFIVKLYFFKNDKNIDIKIDSLYIEYIPITDACNNLKLNKIVKLPQKKQ